MHFSGGGIAYDRRSPLKTIWFFFYHFVTAAVIINILRLGSLCANTFLLINKRRPTKQTILRADFHSQTHTEAYNVLAL